MRSVSLSALLGTISRRRRPSAGAGATLLTPGTRIWMLNAAVVTAALSLAIPMLRFPPPAANLSIPWPLLAAGFYLAEVLIVHLQFRKDAHTISMSEIPMLIGIWFMSPAALLAGQLIGSLVALLVHRRQRFVKLVFNLGQLTLQTGLALAVYRIIANSPPDFGLRALAGSLAAMLAALWFGHAMVLTAIRVSGGTEKAKESLEVLAFSSIGTVGSTFLALGAGIVISFAPRLWWLGLVPVVLVYVAYRAYVAQSREKGRVVALYDAATTLHRNPQIDRAVVSFSERVIDLTKAEAAQVVLLPAGEDHRCYVTTVDVNGGYRVMTPVEDPVESRALGEIAEMSRGMVLNGDSARLLGESTGTALTVHDALLVPLTLGAQTVGCVTALNRVGDISAFTEDDLRVLQTLASQLSVTLENGRLTETLAELRTLQQQLEEMLESKSRLIGSVSHELRTPLTGVIGLAAVVREDLAGKIDPESEGMLDLIVEQGTELANIIEDLLAHARAEAGTLTIRPESFSLHDEITTVVATHTEQVAVDSPDPAVTALADPLRFRQILRNLLTNARRYGGPNVEIVVRSGNDRIEVSVTDDGEGVPPDQVEEIFQPYLSAHDQAGQPGSVGLGLALARTIARMMDGDLVYRRIGEKTQFTLRLPTRPVDIDLIEIPVAADGTHSAGSAA